MDDVRAPLRERLAGLLALLEAGLVERRQVLRASLLAALAGEHTLLVGPPGTAKSALARRIHLAFRDARYFERLLTRFTVPEELFGPLSIRALEEDRYERHVAGFLPDAAVAFIDEVFKANSAILNALLTLLNEREFDNGAGRLRCPLISVVGATNVVPEDEVAEAFFDRFLLRLTVAPVSAEGFRRLLGEDRAALPEALAPPSALQLDEADLGALAQAAAACALPAAVLDRLAELRAWLAGRGVYVSDRRWVKLAHLLRVAAASEGRAAASEWDLGLVPYCVAADEPARLAVAEWLAARLGVREAWSPPRITRVVEAFEAQLATEREARDLDYDEAGRLRFTASDPAAQAGELAGAIGDAKGGSAALRMSYARMRRYGSLHIGARTAQLDGVLARLAAYRGELGAQRAALEAWAEQALWADPAFIAAARAGLEAVDGALAGLEARARGARAGFEALPRLEQAGVAPAAVEHDALPE
ncbi:MAG TPA: AAA family ATPase [Thauera sp.]|jgi:MoxR-like ATPase|uniref:AAA family ATPase n=1 Tax=Thauera sp. TaxID=1905334 RepID=UPI000FA637BF|nr:AAA family ATPase [Thauera sp.]MCP5223951.1 AAA family ATPase [Thauera sp.]RTL27979.1 MAG: AAA family ATPase [Rhodocyclaceae bacterium]HPE04007.1 AAA family ATPase [Thauera sp.]HRV79403.1 AAA family ATPase [Thauera sp.]